MKFEGPKQEASNLDRSTEKHSFELWNKCFKEIEGKKKDSDFDPPIERNEKGEILAPNGMVSRLPNEDFVKVTRTSAFKEWFGDWVNDPKNSSKVVYEDTREPMVVYHGTDKDINVREGLKLGTGENGRTLVDFIISKRIIYFSASLDGAQRSNDSSIFQCFLNIKKLSMFDNNHTHKIASLFFLIKEGFVFKNRKSDVILGVSNKKDVMHLPSAIEWIRKGGK